MIIKSFREYTELASVTNADLGTDRLNADHYLFGMITESTEMLYFANRVNLNEEAGDFLWYASKYCELRGLDTAINTAEIHFLNEEFKNKKTFKVVRSNILELQRMLVDIVDIEKKNMAYGKEFNKYIVSDHMARIFTIICETTDMTIKSICEANIMKLKERYGEKFSKHAAINRNTDAENVILESKLS